MVVTLEATHARLDATETKLEATENKLEATVTKLEATENKLEATETKLEATENKLEATVTELEATENKLEATVTELEATETRLEATETKLEATMAKLQDTTAELKATRADVRKRFKSGSSFIRWGSKSCPISTSLVYAGVAGGKHYQHTGSGTNRLCLTRTPQYDNTPTPKYYGYLYGAEYQEIPGLHDHDVPCTVCLVPQSTTIMVPATLTCPPGWTPRYTGHLASERHNHQGSEYVCMDGNLEHDSTDTDSHNGNLFYYTLSRCGSLNCPPFINNRVVTCVVCSK